MKVLTHRLLPSAAIEMSTGSGVFAGSPIGATSRACHSPLASCFISHSFDVSAEAVMAQLSASFSDQRISSGAPGVLSTLVGFMDLKSHTTIVLPNCFMAAGSAISLPRSAM